MKRLLTFFLMLLLLAGFVPPREARAETTYEITLDPNGGGGPSGCIPIADGGDWVVEDPSVYEYTAPAGMEFDGWDIGGVRYQAGDTYMNITSDITAVAQWKKLPGTYIVTVSGNGNGTASASPQSGETGTEITLTATPDGGYAFKAWKVLSGGVTVTDGKFTIGSADVQVQAIFEAIAISHLITLDPNGGGGLSGYIPILDGGDWVVEDPSVYEITAPAGKEFDGWDIAGTRYRAGETCTNITADIKAVAQWRSATTPADPSSAEGSAKTVKTQAKKTVKLTAPKVKKATYQWYYRTSKTAAWQSMGKKGTKQKLVVKATMAVDGYQYRCQVKAPTGTVSYTDIYELYVYEQLKVRKQPKWGKICYPGTKRTISVTAQGADSYQWVTRPNGSAAWTKIEGATGASYVVDVQEGMNNRQYACEITGRAGLVRSKAAVVKIAPWPKVKITKQPVWKKPVASGAPVTLSVKALNAETYQWYYRTSAKGTWIILGGETKTALTFTAPANGNGYQYKCTVKGKGGTVDTKPVTLKVAGN